MPENIKMKPNPKVISHRGRGNGFYDNTIEALSASVEKGFACIEFDVRRTKDGVIVLHHDEDMRGILLSELNFDEAFDMAEEDGFRLATLEEVCLNLGKKVIFDVELKEEGYEKEVLDIVLKYMGYKDFFATSFNPKIIKRLRSIDKNTTLGLIIGSESHLFNPFAVRMALRFPSSLKLIGASRLMLEHRMFKDNVKKNLVKSEVEVYLWVVNEVEEYNNYLNSPELHGIATDVVILEV